MDTCEDYDEWKRELNLSELPICHLNGTELVTHVRYDKTEYQSYDEQYGYPEGDQMRYVCKCGSDQFAVYTVQSYETRVRCTVCGNDQCVHSG
jgi:hypothetical protein